MSKTIKTLLALVLMLSVCAVSYGQADRPVAEEKTATFVFLPGNDLFLLKGNEVELERLYALVDEYRTEIAAGEMPVYVDGYCASLPTSKENLTTAFVRANRVKSELILSKGLTEANFITNNYAHAFLNNKDIVVVTLRIPAKEEPRREEPVREEPRPQESQVKAQPQPEPEPQPTQEPVSAVAPEPAVPAKPYCFAVRTNVLYDAMLLPTLGVEWRVNRDLGIKLDGSLAWWGNEKRGCRRCGCLTRRCGGICSVTNGSTSERRVAMGNTIYISTQSAALYRKIRAIRARCGMQA